MSGSVELEKFTKEIIRKSIQIGYTPRIFCRMRRQRGTVEAMRDLVVSSEIQSGFKRLKELNRLELSIEAAILQFPDEFTSEHRDAARWRLKQAGVKGALQLVSGV